ncbi:protein tyrosine phosphatase family protein [Waterburya agarophytonicola K14]|uniref:Protein tyrosine phosphatase family protein n=1 Tax=Waterburya agarophytonicola KI4 TaxID=2874699 RepID=A0A964BP97_9CYAN|nr:protein tyrosine phosphatase family protein [Waterburya agarophytonicola KI4]
MKSIQDYYQINENIATSGQPTPEQFPWIKDAGYRVIVNLAMSCSTNALANEGAIVTDLGLVYIQIPVVWENPTLDDVKLFFQTMRAFQERKVWVHCAKNMRVSCFIYFWQKYVLRLSEAEARYPMNQIWQPTGVWQQLIECGSSLELLA